MKKTFLSMCRIGTGSETAGRIIVFSADAAMFFFFFCHFQDRKTRDFFEPELTGRLSSSFLSGAFSRVMNVKIAQSRSPISQKNDE